MTGTAAEPNQSVPADEIELRLELVVQVLQRDVVFLNRLARDVEVRSFGAARVAPRRRRRSPQRWNSGRSTGSSCAFQFASCVPLTMSRFSASSAVLRVCTRHGEVLLGRRRLRLGLDDVDRRHRADLDARLVVLDELIGQRHRLLRHVDRLDGEHVVPIRAADVRQRVSDRRAKLNVRDVAIDLRHARAADASSRCRSCAAAAAYTNLTRTCCRSGCTGCSGWSWSSSIVVQRHGERPAAPRHALRDAAVERRRPGDDRRADEC